MRWSRTTGVLLGVLGALALVLAAGCELEPYCVGGRCGEPPPADGPRDDGDGGGDVGRDDAPGGDADGDADGGDGGDADGTDDGADVTCPDGTDFMTDPANCGWCGHRCNLPNAWNVCEGGECRVDRCDVNYWNIDDNDANGCEYYCIPTVDIPGECTDACVPTVAGGECDTTCNNYDDDCNGGEDDCVDHESDPLNCGPICGRACRFPNAELGVCVDGVCHLADCLPGYWNLDGEERNGCEYECGPTTGDPPPPESCNSQDDDCDGDTDEENPEGGASCGETEGRCEPGTVQCLGGALECVGATGPFEEECNGADDDCDGDTDEPEDLVDTGALCGTSVGACEQGTTICVAGTLECDGAVEPVIERCNNIDDDCDGDIDEDPELIIDCLHRPGVCVPGTPLCDSGEEICDGEAYGTIEACNGVDDDCDTETDEDFDLLNDYYNCGSCGHDCDLGTGTVGQCRGGDCEVASCLLDYWDINGDPTDGCEYHCARVAPDYDTCNGRDDDCDTLTDAADPNFSSSRPSVGAPHYFCSTVGACAGVTVQCGIPYWGGSLRWYCSYTRPPVEVLADGTIAPEDACDGVDEDCDGTTDENWPGVVHSPADPADSCSAGLGGCLRTGTYVCDTGGGGQHCTATAGPAGTETCNGVDDNCDGTTDNMAEDYFFAAGGPGLAVQVSGSADTNRDGSRDTARTLRIMRYEASRPDATASSAGSISNQRACVAAGVLPWTNVTWTQARDACCRLNSDGTCHYDGSSRPQRWNLCMAYDWQLGCERYSGGYYTYPYGNSYVASTCNGNDYDTTPGGSDDDAILAVGAMSNCRNPSPGFPPSNSWIWDASGNVKEWTYSSRVVSGTTYRELRGGASNNSSLGLTCTFDFTLGSESFSFPNVGFRCCYY